MASSQQTAVFKLCQWLENDPVLREDFNADNNKIEQALTTQASSFQQSLNTQISRLEQILNTHTTSLAKLQPVTGAYTGSGKNYSQDITLGFMPSMVLVLPKAGLIINSSPIDFGMAIYGWDCADLRITYTGFAITGAMNYSGSEGTAAVTKSPYRYFALR